MPHTTGDDLTALLCTAVVSATAGAALMRGCMAGAAPQTRASRCPAKASREQHSTTDELGPGVSATSESDLDVEIEYCTVREHAFCCLQARKSFLLMVCSHCKTSRTRVGLQMEPQGSVDGSRVRD